VDAIEIFNARCMIPADNKKARGFAHLHNLPGTVGSDAHTVFEVGTACLVLPMFSKTEDLRIAILEGVMKGRLSPFWVHLFSRFASLRKKVV
jgi:predicted metal-dependent phosphoesterase TrpH